MATTAETTSAALGASHGDLANLRAAGLPSVDRPVITPATAPPVAAAQATAVASAEISEAAPNAPPPLPARSAATELAAPAQAAPPVAKAPPVVAPPATAARASSAAPPPPLPAATVPAPPPRSAVRPSATAPAAEPELPHELEVEPIGFGFWSNVPSWLVSTVFHLVLVLLLATYTFIDEVRPQPTDLSVVASTGATEAPLEDLKQEIEIGPQPVTDETIQAPNLTELASRALDAGPALSASAPQIDFPIERLGNGRAGELGELLAGGNPISSTLPGRMSAAHRARMVARDGGTPQSEEAVAQALEWLSRHQNSDGSWSFDHRTSPKCNGKCQNAGNQTQAKIAATAVALLPFLGTGQTHREGKYKNNISKGLYYLVQSMRVEGEAGSLLEPGGRMYGHGLASIALCEAYGMTRDHFFQAPAQSAVNFIVMAQDPSGGGWRYYPQQAGDTSVVGWQLMALKSAHMAYLKVPPETTRKASYFLDSVQIEQGNYGGFAYGYTGPGNGPATTAIGLLCRMYLGWERENPSLVKGVQMLGKAGPSTDKQGPPRNNMYYNYYGTQVMHHYGGNEWQVWNYVMREYLIKTQSHKGHEHGSWYFEGTDHGSPGGGRLYCTAMAAMILEVYYRHMPLYTDLSTKDKFRN